MTTNNTMISSSIHSFVKTAALELKNSTRINAVSSSFNNIKDKINTYQTGVSKPMFIHIKKGKVAYHLSITDFKIEAAREYLNKL